MGSEMCIRDRFRDLPTAAIQAESINETQGAWPTHEHALGVELSNNYLVGTLSTRPRVRDPHDARFQLRRHIPHRRSSVGCRPASTARLREQFTLMQGATVTNFMGLM